MRNLPMRRCLYTLCICLLACIGLIHLQSTANTSGHRSAPVIDNNNPAMLKHTTKRTDSSSTTSGGQAAPTDDYSALWPSSLVDNGDRILSQLEFKLPDNYVVERPLVVMSRDVPSQREFKESKCNVDNCIMRTYEGSTKSADVIVFNSGPPSNIAIHESRHQIWVDFQLESGLNSGLSSPSGRNVNWTATYRRDSTLNTPYERFVPYDSKSDKVRQAKIISSTTNYALGKNKKVAWFVSNCNAVNGRSKYVEELSKYINVDIYGQCGPLKCPRRSANECFKLLDSDYKFFLAFENSNCKDYITEKLYWNALNNRVVPVVMGATAYEYSLVAPPESFIHVDDFEGPKQLAEYLHKVDADDQLYNSFFKWKGTGEFINTKFWCRVCAMAHLSRLTGHKQDYPRVEDWWSGRGVCLPPPFSDSWNSWRSVEQSKPGDFPPHVRVFT